MLTGDIQLEVPEGGVSRQGEALQVLDGLQQPGGVEGGRLAGEQPGASKRADGRRTCCG